MFSIRKEMFGRFEKLVLSNDTIGEYVSVIPGFGAKVHEIVLSRSGRLYSLLDSYSSDKEMIGNRGAKGNKLVPFPNRVNKGTYHFKNSEFRLPINSRKKDHAIHGFVYDKAFLVKNSGSGADEAFLELEYDYSRESQDWLEGYPFSFRLTITCRLSGQGFSCSTRIENTGEEEMPVGDGWHPYFCTRKGGSIDSLYLKLPSSIKAELDDAMIPTGKTIAYVEFSGLRQIKDAVFDSCFLIEAKEGGVAETIIFDKDLDLEIAVWQQLGAGKYNFVQVYTPESRESIAVEPMSCMPDAFNNRKGLVILKPEESFDAEYGVTLR